MVLCYFSFYYENTDHSSISLNIEITANAVTGKSTQIMLYRTSVVTSRYRTYVKYVIIDLHLTLRSARCFVLNLLDFI
jgi:hypothetical protein